MRKNKIYSMLIPLLLGSISINAYAEEILYSLDDLKASNIASIQKAQNLDKISDLRANALKEIALEMGVSSGLAAQFKVYEMALENKSAELDRQYNFEALKLSAGVLPPVLSQGFSNYEKESDDVVQISDKNFKIEKPAQIVSVYPTWRDYLKFDFKPARLPSQNFMPKTRGEKALWDRTVKEGWEEGVRQADVVFQNAFGQLNRDYEGMILYKQLLANGAITPAIVATANLGVTGDGTQMSVNHRVMTITNHATFQTDRSRWKNNYPATFKDEQGRNF